MRYLLAIVLVFSLSQVAFANAKTQLEKVNNPTQYKLKEDIKNKKSNVKQNKNNSLTNYQYDEENYHYDKHKKYLKENLEYSQSGRMKY